MYDPVPHSHVVPAGYLRMWASGKRLAMRQVGAECSVSVGVRDAGVRSNFYRRTRPATGETIYDIEWSMQQAESVGLPVLGSIRDHWPLALDDKGKIGQLLGLQYLRGPAFRVWWEAWIESEATRWRSDPEKYGNPSAGMTHVAAIESVVRATTSDTYRLTQMLKFTRSVGIVLTSMHWTLVSIPRRAATSDHPVVVWPLTDRRRRPTPNNAAGGVLDTLEIFVPVGPDLLLLMTWRDAFDERTVLSGRGSDVGTANAFVVANADKQWFHEIGVEPWTAKGSRAPLSAGLVRGYNASEAASSSRREMARQLANAEMAAPLSNEPISVVGVG